MHDIDTKLLRAFLTVAAERSFSRAAMRLGCSQATMSQRILQLEALLGVALLRRDYHDVTLTPAGQDLRAEAQALVDAHDGLVARVMRGRVAGSVRLGIAEDYVLPLLPQLWRRLGQFPGVEIAVVTGLSRDLCRQVEARSLDMAVVTLPETLPLAKVLARPPLLWVAAPGFEMPQDGVLPLALFPEGCAFRATALPLLTQLHRLALVSASGQVIHAAVVAGLAATVMAAGTIPQDLAPLNGLPELPLTCIQIVTREQGLSPAGEAVRGLVEGLW
ncbi:LysR family transcriptional regulator [Stagnihabitans tardus]|uniref:LysR family transcriptional regulator n=1 Tax=Stagnihabitans tardus TaxID=2699202 RepID=A0AAE4YDI9_9RHOB|nr:LysR family transcriptional regulator [Stagnihabitans tardus]NBZ90099.1 LysR family transcriptional regulator [Stagnihabitans tardus]